MFGQIKLEKLLPKNKRSGQTTLEYILLLSIVIAIFVLVSNALQKGKIADKVAAPIVQDYRRAYQFGNVKAKGLETEEIELHPRVVNGNNFRIFLNPD